MFATLQQDEGVAGSWVHAYLHRKEGDHSNAAYWYRRAGQTVCGQPLDAEWVAVACPGSDGMQAKSLNALFEKLPDFRWNKDQERKLRTELYKVLRPLVGTEKMIEVANRLLRLQRV